MSSTKLINLHEMNSDVMKEIEIKIIEIDKKRVEDNLAALGAAKTFDGDVETWFFDFQDDTITGQETCFVFRRIGDKADLAFKKFSWRVRRQRLEIEYEVSDSDFATMP